MSFWSRLPDKASLICNLSEAPDWSSFFPLLQRCRVLTGIDDMTSIPIAVINSRPVLKTPQIPRLAAPTVRLCHVQTFRLWAGWAYPQGRSHGGIRVFNIPPTPCA